MSFYLKDGIDYKRHNEEVAAVWDAYRKGRPIRTPVTATGSISNLFCNGEINKTGCTFEDFFREPDAQIACQLAYQDWVRHNVLCDREMGPPAAGWQLGVDLQNSYEAGWFGCELVCRGNEIPDTVPMFREQKELLYDTLPPDPLRGGLLGKAMEMFEAMREKCRNMEFRGAPVLPPKTIPGEGTDGTFTAACNLRGAGEVCTDMYEDTQYFHDLMTFITDNTIRRIKAIKEWRWSVNPGSPDAGIVRSDMFWFADDSIQLLSLDQYREFVFPYHRRLADEFTSGPVAIHLCGNVMRHFKFLCENLGVVSFDTGFPMDHGRVRRELGTSVEIQGGPSIMLLKSGTPGQIRDEVKRILGSGVMEGGKFILREGNNLAPCTPVENIAAMYEAGKEFGVYG